MKKNKPVFCTYFDKGFLQKGLALHTSLIKHNPDAELWVLAFDKYTEDILKRMKLKGVIVISLSEFEDDRLLAVKRSRNVVEYYWTCTPSLPLYVFKKKPSIKLLTYLDADLYFYSDATIGVDEIGKNSILAVPHRFPKNMESLAIDSGVFNVAFNVFKNDATGIKCLKRWRKQCLDWCFWRHEDGKLGDQMYLNEWPKLYRGKFTKSSNIGVDAAPWNISQYKVSKKGKFVYLDDTKLSCYHFHQFQILGANNFSRVLGYTLSRDIIKNIYEPYEAELRKQYKIVKKYDPGFKIEIIEKDKNKFAVIKQKLAKYIGPVYWKVKTWIKN